MAEVDRGDGAAAVPEADRRGAGPVTELRAADGVTVGSRPSFTSFYDEHRDRIATALALTVRSAPLGAEAADEAMARAYGKWEDVSRMENPAGWVYRVGLNWTRSLLRRRRREELVIDVEAIAASDRHIDVDLERALACLSVDHRAVVVARHLLGFSTADTAAALGVSEGTVKSRLSRALDHLRSELEETHG